MYLAIARHRTAVVLILAAVLLGSAAIFLNRTTHATPTNSLIKLSRNDGFADGVSIPATDGRLVKFQAGRDLNMDGVISGLRAEGIEIGAAEAISLASDDINGDGYPDLVCGYRTPVGGFAVVFYGDEGAYSPSDEQVLSGIRETRYPMPFASARVVTLGGSPDMLVTGDFDRDGRKDIIAATKGGSSIELIGGNRDTGFRPAERISVAGPVTTMGAGRLGGDSNADLVVGVGGDPALLVYGSNESILTQRPEVRPIAAAADHIAFGAIDNVEGDDIVASAGSKLVVMEGRSGRIDTIDLPSNANDIAVGEFVWDRDSRPEIAAVGDDGITRVIANGRLDTRAFTGAEILAKRRLILRVRNGEMTAPAVKPRPADWRVTEEIASSGTLIFGARISTQPSDDLILAGGDIDVVTRDKVGERSSTRLAPTDEPVAILPMRLSVIGVPGMVMLQKGKIEPTIVMVAPQSAFVVDTATDNAGLTACTAAAGDCSLRGAIIASNTNGVGLDTITFNAGINPVLTLSSGTGFDNVAATGDLDVNGSLTITGNAPTTLTTTFTNTCGDCKLFGMDQTGGFPGINVSISGMNMSGGFNNGAAFCGTFFETGGSIDFFLQNTGNVFSLSGSTVSGGTVTGCAQSHGGGVNIDSVNTQTAAGAIAGTATLTNNTISGNTSQREGAGVSAFGDKHDTTLTGNTIQNNTISGAFRGGGLLIQHAWGGTVTVNGGSITGNSANTQGGGIAISGNQVATIGPTTGVTISGNSVTAAGGFGGGVSVTNTGALGVTGNNTIANSSISTNHADTTGLGGGIYFLSAYPLTINATTISSNTATTGAGVFNGGSGNLVTINNGSQINSNAATGAGGGLRNEASNSTTTLDSVQLNTNTSGSGGDAIDMNNGTISLVGTVTLGDGESINLTAGTFTSTSGTLNLGGSLTRATGATFTHNSGTVVFNGLGTQNINGTATSAAFNNLTVNKGAGIAGPAGSVTAVTVAGNVSLTGNTLAVGSQSISVGGNWNNSGGSFNGGSGTVTFNGGAAQSIGGSTQTVFNGLTINNAAGITMTANESATGLFTLTNGNVTVNSPNVFSLGTLSTVSRTSGHVIGSLFKQFSGPGPLFVYPLGTGAQYTPMDVTVTAGAGSLTASATAAVAPLTPVALGSGTTLHRYWTLSGSGITSTIVFHYLAGDVFGTEANYRIIRVTGGSTARAYPNNATTFVTPASHTFSVIGLTTYSDWTAGEPLPPTASPASISGRVMTADGRSLGRVRVVVTDSEGNPRTALTNGFGYYSVEGLTAGQTYIVSAQSKLFTFAPRTISLGDDATGFDLTAEP